LPFRCDIALKRFFQIRHVAIFPNFQPSNKSLRGTLAAAE
jgi:hypothetical protein